MIVAHIAQPWSRRSCEVMRSAPATDHPNTSRPQNFSLRLGLRRRIGRASSGCPSDDMDILRPRAFFGREGAGRYHKFTIRDTDYFQKRSSRRCVVMPSTFRTLGLPFGIRSVISIVPPLAITSEV